MAQGMTAGSALPPSIRFGTSTWTYAGWKGIVYQQSYRNEKEFRQNSLREYAQSPLFQTVGIDHTFYRPPTKEQLTHYASLVPDDFKWVSKVWEHVTIPVYPEHERYGNLRGVRNKDFLHAQFFLDRVLSVYSHEEVKKHVGPFLFQFPHIPREVVSVITFLGKLNSFLGSLPKEFQYAIEVRNPDFLIPEYFQVLNTHEVTHCFNHWNFMPPLLEQMKKAAQAGGVTAPFLLARILTPLGMNYRQAVEAFQPYDKIKRENPEMRADVVRFVKRALQRGVEAYVIVNNRAEGHAPGTIQAIQQALNDTEEHEQG